MSDDGDWRLQFDLPAAAEPSRLDRLIHRGDRVAAADVTAGLPEDVVVTHDGARLFAYAADRETLAKVRDTLGARLASDGLAASVTLSRWDEPADAWRQVDPPLAAGQARQLDALERAADEPDSRTLVAHVGELIRPQFEQTMLDTAAQLGIECEIVEHHHLLRSQVAFRISGQRYKLDEFARVLQRDAATTVRCENTLLLSPL